MIQLNEDQWKEIVELQDGDSNQPPAGGYAMVIRDYADRPDKEYLELLLDFAEGPYKGWASGVFDRTGYWPVKAIRSYKKAALPFFKGFKTSLEASNRNYQFRTDNLDGMIGKFIGAVVGEREYMDKKGQIRTGLKVTQLRSGKSIREGDFTIPEKELLKTEPTPYAVTPGNQEWAALTGDDGDIPF